MASLPKIGTSLPPHPSDYAGMAAFMRPKVRPFYEGKAWVHLIDPLTVVTTPNIKTGDLQVLATPMWSGWARVQPVRNSVNSWRANNPTTTRTVQFWVDDPESLPIDFRPGLRLVLDPDDTIAQDNNDPELALYQFIVSGGINSTQAWQRTIDTTVDLEGRPEYDTSAWPKPPEA